LITADSPVNYRYMPLFTRDNAAILGKQGAIARWAKPEPPAFTPPLPDSGAKEVSLATRAQIAAIDSRLTRAASMDPETLDLLTRSKERLWKILAHAAGIAAPANFKQERKRSGNASIVDLEPVPLPALTEVNEEPAPSSATTPSPASPAPGQSQAQSPSSTGDLPPNGPALP
jgi:hypothetical protein